MTRARDGGAEVCNAEGLRCRGHTWQKLLENVHRICISAASTDGHPLLDNEFPCTVLLVPAASRDSINVVSPSGRESTISL